MTSASAPSSKVDILGRVPLVAIAVSAGVFIIAVSFQRGRSVLPYSGPIYWIGELFLYLAPAIVLFGRRRVTKIEGIGIAGIIGIATYCVKECYTLLTFTFSDEYQHLVTLQGILHYHGLFHPNPTLPVSPYYPGLEILTSLVVTFTHLSANAAAVVVIGTAHLMATVGLFYLAYEIHPNVRTAAVTVLVYSTGTEYPTFTSYFAYESLALPLVIFGLLAVIKMIKADDSSRALLWGAVAAAMATATVVTHHASSFILLLITLVIIGFQMYSPTRKRSRKTFVAMGLSGAAFLGVWSVVIAKPTFSYLSKSFSRLLLAGHKPTKVASTVLSPAVKKIISTKSINTAAPPLDHYVGYAWGLLIAVSVALGILLVLKDKRYSTPLNAAMALSAPIVFFGFAVQFVAAGGLASQVSERLSVYALIPGSMMCAIALDAFMRQRASDSSPVVLPYVLKPIGKFARVLVRRRFLTLAFVSLILGLGAISLGFPSFDERIPGPYLVGGNIRTYDPYDISAAQWAKSNFPPGEVIATDVVNSELMAAIANQYESGYVSASLILGAGPSASINNLIKELGLQFVIADKRITSGIPILGYPVFSSDPYAGHYSEPIPKSTLNKFNSIKGVSLVFDDGPIKIYDINGSPYSDSGTS